jgi:hypothetical protein
MRWTQKYINFLLDGSEYYDFELATEGTAMYGYSTYDDDAVIDINVCSGFTSTIRWSGATMEAFTLDFITTTGLDNYFVDTPNAYSGGTIDTSISAVYTDDEYFEFHPVSGWSTNISYEIIPISNCAVKLNGGFYQGFFKLYEYPYEMMPSRMRKGWTVDMIVGYPDGKSGTGTTLNDLFSNNGGFIFYLGTRGEDKYWNGFTTGATGEETVLFNWSGLTITDPRYLQYYQYAPTSVGQTPSLDPLHPSYSDSNVYGGYTLGYSYGAGTETGEGEPLNFSPLYTQGDEFVTVRIINGEVSGGTSGKTTYESYDYKGYYHYTNHLPYAERYFDDNTIPLYVKYPWKSITDNAFGIRIRPDGHIGYRVLRIGNVCQTGTTTNIDGAITGTTTPIYQMEEAYSSSPIYTAANNGSINITIVFERYIELNDCELIYNDYRKGTLTIYVNARPVFREENFEEIIPHALDRQKELQNGVPFNISWGGGTQGLLESVTFGGIDAPDRNLLLQNFFAGSFTGSLQTFKMYIRPLHVPQIIHNFELRKAQYNMLGDFGGRYIFITRA